MLGTDAEQLTLHYSTRVQWLMASLSGNLDGHAKEGIRTQNIPLPVGHRNCLSNIILLLVMRLCFDK